MVLLAGLLAACSGPSAAPSTAPSERPPQPSDDVWSECEEASTQLEINACLQDVVVAARAELARAYERARAVEDDAGRELLRTAQQRWEAFVQADCESAAHRFAGGTMQPAERLACLATAARSRTRRLRARYDDDPTTQGYPP